MGQQREGLVPVVGHDRRMAHFPQNADGDCLVNMVVLGHENIQALNGGDCISPCSCGWLRTGPTFAEGFLNGCKQLPFSDRLEQIADNSKLPTALRISAMPRGSEHHDSRRG